MSELRGPVLITAQLCRGIIYKFIDIAKQSDIEVLYRRYKSAINPTLNGDVSYSNFIKNSGLKVDDFAIKLCKYYGILFLNYIINLDYDSTNTINFNTFCLIIFDYCSKSSKQLQLCILLWIIYLLLNSIIHNSAMQYHI